MAPSFQRVAITLSSKYKHSGSKSYVYAMSKCMHLRSVLTLQNGSHATDGFNTTKPGPYFREKTFAQQGKFGVIGGRMRSRMALRKRAVSPQTSAASDDTTPTSAADSSSAGEVPAEDIQNDSLYLCEVDIGTPAQKLYLDFDTGSSDLWVWSTELSKTVLSQANAQNQHVAFDPKKSSTFKKLNGSTWKISYGDSSAASGDVGTDVIDLGGLKVEGQAIELAESLSTQFVQVGVSLRSETYLTSKPCI
jgi:hypothetical protein